MAHKNSCMGFLICVFVACSSSPRAAPPGVMLANVYEQDINLKEYWASEKLDGVRAYWDGKQLKSRNGNMYRAPAWFTDDFPDQPLDGELWIGRGTFEQLVSTVRKQTPDHDEWRKVSYQVFDLPTSRAPFTERLALLKQLFKKLDNPHIKMVEQTRATDHDALMQQLNQVRTAGGEGLMLHRGSSYYQSGRSNDLLKVKPYQDAEAVVVKHLAGKGKFKGVLGSIEVKMPSGRLFRIGSGFSNMERQDPPPVGSTITYKYFGLTQKGIPRFATFLRIREEH